MKKTLLSIISILTLSGLGFAQGYSINVQGQPGNMSGQVFSEQISEDANLLHIVDFQVHNNSGASTDLLVTRSILSISSGWSEQFCWGNPATVGTCYSTTANPYSSAALTVLNGDSIALTVDITAPTSGSATMRYYIYENGNSTKLDSVDVMVTSTLGAEEKKIAALKIAPNPANNYVNINFDGTQPAEIKVVDVLGNVVLSETISNSKKLDVSSFRNGIYFVTVMGEDTKPVTRKLIVRH